MNKDIKMIVMDLDDTLLNDDLVISDYTKQVIFNAQKKGIKIVLASGRPAPAIEKYAKELKLKENNGYVISYNGAVLTEMSTGTILNRTTLTLENIDFLLKTAKDKNLFFQTYINGKVVTDRHNQYTDFEGELTGMPVIKIENLKDEIKEEVVKIILMDDPDRLKLVEEELKTEIGNTMTMNISKPFFLEFTNTLVDKDKTITYLCNKIGIDKGSVMAIGDSFNDLSMIKGCGIGIVMSNGHNDVKKHAHHITHCNNTDGVATAINRFALAV
ncbi:HAD family phosphatase [Thiospirochaeta perfilievii]|uniref:HAD family phosphatase n=1 Tax=Thiospirochaeta perfilievii TaxID=252967 RepID=A0A5C1QAZ7_9SPIO|nr:Cof-type HAD-IIB family hydrolase [Thiospirochaeta perfilievii]QEN03976.1 HAD family phosphatase [Thiospirochaeta perfilievii]